MLSKDSVKLLKWMNKNDGWIYYRQLEKNCPVFEYRAFNAIENGKYIDSIIDEFSGPELDEYGSECYPKQYRINAKGSAYLELMTSDRWKEARNWISFFIAVAAFMKSFFF